MVAIAITDKYTVKAFPKAYPDRRRAIVNYNSYEDGIIYDLEKSC